MLRDGSTDLGPATDRLLAADRRLNASNLAQAAGDAANADHPGAVVERDAADAALIVALAMAGGDSTAFAICRPGGVVVRGHCPNCGDLVTVVTHNAPS